MLIETWMTHRLHFVKPLDSIQHAREIMEAQRINQLPVVVDGRVVGIITDRDLRDAYPSVFDSARHRTHDRGDGILEPSTIAVETVMTPHVVTLSPNDSIVEAARRMRKERIGAIPITDNGRLVGILTRSDVLDAFAALAESLPTPVTEAAGKERKRADTAS